MGIAIALSASVGGPAWAFPSAVSGEGQQLPVVLEARKLQELEARASAEVQRIVDKQRRIDGQEARVSASVRMDVATNTVVVYLGKGYVPKFNGGELEDLLDQLMHGAFGIILPEVAVRGIDFRFGGKPITFYFPEDAPPPRLERGR